MPCAWGMSRSESAGSLTTVAFFPAVASAPIQVRALERRRGRIPCTHGPARSTLLLSGAETVFPSLERFEQKAGKETQVRGV
jgi:hypothetical protein